MSDYRDQLERERRKYAMRDGTLEGLQRRRDRKRRNGQIAAGVIALLIAAAGIGGGLFALRSAEKVPPAHNPTPSPTTGLGGQVGGSPPSAPLQFVDDRHGWVVVAGRIEATANGGTSWSPQDTVSNVSEIQFINAKHGWAITGDGLLRTADGGSTWAHVGERGFTFADVQFYDDQHGWGIRRDLPPDSVYAGTVVKTIDGGETWKAQSLQADAICTSTDGKTRSVWAAGPGEGGMSLARTTNEGFSWYDNPFRVPQGEPWSATLECFGNEVWVQVRDGGAAGHNPYGVFQSVDGGQARLVMQEAGTRPFGPQQGVYEAADPYPGPFAAVGQGAAYILNWCPACGGDLPFVSIERTHDGGGTWAVATIVDSNRPGEPVGISFIDPDNGWVLLGHLIGEHRNKAMVVLRTSDGGQTWEQP
jgi:photosystem II stability/assembly factor-like uncharacterized protein